MKDYESRLPIRAILDWLHNKREIAAGTGTSQHQEAMERHLLISVNYYVNMFGAIGRFFRRLGSSIFALAEQIISVKRI